MQLRQHRRVDLVSLDLGVRDRAHLQRVGDHHSTHEWLQQTHDPGRVDGGLDHHLVVGSKLAAESDHRISCESTRPPLLRCRSPGPRPPPSTVHVQSDHSHATSFVLGQVWESGRHDTYGSALAAQPGWSQGRPDSNASSQLIRYPGLPLHVLPTPLSRLPQDTAGELFSQPAGGAPKSCPITTASSRIIAGSKDGSDVCAASKSMVRPNALPRAR